ncbi:MAG: hypothetical protein DMG26_04100 [Acidobacteria bacterium]|nr:MAG: hypothetical protein DMG26_04100 [Acidobacteriota bacterium]
MAFDFSTFDFSTLSRLRPPNAVMPLMRSLLEPVLEHPAFRAALEAAAGAARERSREVTLSGLTRAGKAMVVAGIAHELRARKLDRPVVVLTADNETAERLRETASTFLDWLESGAESGGMVAETKPAGGPALSEANGTPALPERAPALPSLLSVLPALDVSPYEGRSPHAEILERRAVTLWSIARGRTRVLFVPLPAAMARFRDRAFYGSLALELRLRDEIDLDDMVEHLARIGYEAGEPVTNVGQYSVRGGIVDVFPPEAANPLRIEFFGDTIESLREFDPATQRSQKPITSTTLLPLAETPRSPRFFAALVGALLLRQGSGIRGPRSEERESGVRSQELQPGISPNPESRIPNPEPEWAAQYSGPFPGWEFFVPLAEPHPNSLLSLLDQSVRNAASGSSLLVWDEKLGRMQELRRALEGHAAAYDEVRDIVPRRPQPEDVFLTEDEFLKSVEGAPQVSLKEFGVRSSEFGVELANSELSNSELFLPTEPAPATPNFSFPPSPRPSSTERSRRSSKSSSRGSPAGSEWRL